MDRVKDKVAIVTGGGGSGRTVCVLLAQEGARMAVVDIDDEAGHETVDIIRSKGQQAIFIKADVTSVRDIEKCVDDVLRLYGRIDILVNCVGGAKGITLDEIDDDLLEQNIALNLKSAIFCTKAVLPSMRRQKDGSIVYVSSINALLGGFSETAFAAAKAGLHSLVQTLTADYSRDGIRFNVVCSGTIPHESRSWKKREASKPGILDKLRKMYPLARLGEPIDLAYAILFLASDEAAWITGIVLPVDGGISATGGLTGGMWWENLP